METTPYFYGHVQQLCWITKEYQYIYVLFMYLCIYVSGYLGIYVSAYLRIYV